MINRDEHGRELPPGVYVEEPAVRAPVAEPAPLPVKPWREMSDAEQVDATKARACELGFVIRDPRDRKPAPREPPAPTDDPGDELARLLRALGWSEATLYARAEGDPVGTLRLALDRLGLRDRNTDSPSVVLAVGALATVAALRARVAELERDLANSRQVADGMGRLSVAAAGAMDRMRATPPSRAVATLLLKVEEAATKAQGGPDGTANGLREAARLITATIARLTAELAEARDDIEEKRRVSCDLLDHIQSAERAAGIARLDGAREERERWGEICGDMGAESAASAVVAMRIVGRAQVEARKAAPARDKLPAMSLPTLDALSAAAYAASLNSSGAWNALTPAERTAVKARHVFTLDYIAGGPGRAAGTIYAAGPTDPPPTEPAP